MDILNQISVVLPSLDPDEKLTAVIDGLLCAGFTDIILVNDGSKPENLHYFEDAAKHPEVHLLHHSVNRGKGAALKTAFEFFLENRPGYLGVVTVDGDNQHHPEDTKNCALHMAEHNRLVLGVRDFSLPHVPTRSRLGNHITSFVFKLFVGMTISDTQTGLRALPTQDVKTLIQVSGDRFEYETNMLLAMKEQDIPFDEVKIRTVYIEENKSSHFHAIKDSWRIYKLILKHFFLYTGVSLLSAVIDEVLFVVLGHLSLMHTVFGNGLGLTAAATIGARAVSSLFNFFANKNLVFESQVSTGKAMLRYYALAIPQMIAQILLTQGLLTLLQVDATDTILRGLIYGIVMVALFLVSFVVQQRWVFHKNKKSSNKETVK